MSPEAGAEPDAGAATFVVAESGVAEQGPRLAAQGAAGLLRAARDIRQRVMMWYVRVGVGRASKQAAATAEGQSYNYKFDVDLPGVVVARRCGGERERRELRM